MTSPTRADPAGRPPEIGRSRPAASHRPISPRSGDERVSVRRGDRRVGARSADHQPLAASWDPRPPRAPRHRSVGRRGGGRLSRTVSVYGWRIYLLPLLVALTVLALLDVVGSSARLMPSERAASGAVGDPLAPEGSEGGRYPLIPNPVGGPGFEAAKASAELPGGEEFTAAGDGTWQVVPGVGAPYGTGRLFTYTVEVEDGVELVGGPQGFAMTVDNTLNNPKSWIGSGRYRFQRIDDSAGADLRISLTSQLTTREVCGYRIPFDASCWKGDEHRVVINLARWVRGAVAFQGNVVQYQQYVVNHEVGHGLGLSHTPCDVSGQLAPVMMQQTWGVSNDYLAALGTDNVASDGQVCEPNAWPYPTVN
ncbi:MAG: DUF3152 domain-containing protein [Pseudonocardiales bacterium]